MRRDWRHKNKEDRNKLKKKHSCNKRLKKQKETRTRCVEQ